MPLISVIIPIYNTERLLPKCIESVLAQTLSDIEIILIDDGSTDESGKICDSYACKDKRIHVTHIPNHGVSHARNKGIELSQGKYIHFMDSDDRMGRNVIGTLSSHPPISCKYVYMWLLDRGRERKYHLPNKRGTNLRSE